jgi:hypothetical protein
MAALKKPAPADYPVGYGKPPEDTRFKPGNPGRKKKPDKALTFRDRIMQALDRKLTGRKADGEEITRSALELAAEALANDFAKADPDAVKTVVQLAKLNGELAVPIKKALSGVILVDTWTPYKARRDAAEAAEAEAKAQAQKNQDDENVG